MSFSPAKTWAIKRNFFLFRACGAALPVPDIFMKDEKLSQLSWDIDKARKEMINIVEKKYPNYKAYLKAIKFDYLEKNELLINQQPGQNLTKLQQPKGGKL